jgi:hypothetical protein
MLYDIEPRFVRGIFRKIHFVVFYTITQARGRITKQKQSRETGNIGYTRGRITKQKQSRETGNIGYTRGRITKHTQEIAAIFQQLSLCRSVMFRQRYKQHALSVIVILMEIRCHDFT